MGFVLMFIIPILANCYLGAQLEKYDFKILEKKCDPSSNTIDFLVFSIYPDREHLWFLFVLFLIFLIFPLIENRVERHPLLFLFLFIVISAICFPFLYIDGEYHIYRISVRFLFFLLFFYGVFYGLSTDWEYLT